MSLPRYPAYKPSKTDLTLCATPENWESGMLKRWITVKSGDMISSDQETEEGIPIIGGNGIRAYTTESNTTADTLVIGRVGAKCGCVHHVLNDFWASEHAYRVIEKKTIDRRYFFYLLSALDLNRFAIKTAQPLLNTEIVETKWISTPPLSEQGIIGAFLDRETAKIDALIAEQEQLIELLQEKRQAVISHAVTKGLNPEAPMKESGVEWQGEVPEHWDVVQIKWLSPVKRGASPRPIQDPKYFDDCGEYAWVRISDVTASNGRLETTSQRLSELGSSLSVKLKPGSLFVSIAGSVGKPCITRIKACIHDGFVYFPSLQINPEFLELVFVSGDCFGGLGKLGTQLNLNTDTIGAIRVGIPIEEKEVNDIIEYCKQESERLGELETAALSAVNLLRERRSALISAAVTGQIDVRGLVPQEEAAA